MYLSTRVTWPAPPCIINHRLIADILVNDLEQRKSFQRGLLCLQSGLGFHLPGRGSDPSGSPGSLEAAPLHQPIAKPL